MATAVQFRRGNSSDHSSFTGLEGEITVDTDKNTVVVHDGSTPGGIPLAKESAVSSVATQITTADEGTDAECFPVFTTDAVGNLAPKTDTAFKYNASNGTLTTGGMTVNGAGTFNVGTNTFNINSTGIDTALRVSTNSTTNDNGPDILIQRLALPNTSGDNFHRCGDISFKSRNDNSQDHLYAKVRCRAGDHRDGQEEGRLDFFVASGAGGAFGDANAYIEHSFTKDGSIVTGTVTADAYTGHMTSVVTTANQTIGSTDYGVRKIHTGGAVTYTFDATGTISGTKIGKSIVIANAGTDSITCNFTTSKFYKMISGVNPDVSGSGSSSITIAKGGIAEVVITETNKAIVFGAGVS